jgi:hypothetical protein
MKSTNIYRHDHAGFRGWRVFLRRREKIYQRYFSDIEYGSKDASYGAAVQDMIIARQKHPIILRSHSNTGVRNIHKSHDLFKRGRHKNRFMPVLVVQVTPRPKKKLKAKVYPHRFINYRAALDHAVKEKERLLQDAVR